MTSWPVHPTSLRSSRSGLAWRPLPWLEPVADYRFINWRSVALFGGSDKGLRWRNQNVFKLGCKRPGEGPNSSCAPASPMAVPDLGWASLRERLDPADLGAARHIRVGWKPSEAFDLQFAYMHAFKKQLTDDGGDAAGLAADTRITLVWIR